MVNVLFCIIFIIHSWNDPLYVHFFLYTILHCFFQFFSWKNEYKMKLLTEYTYYHIVYRSYGKVNGISINIATWCDLYHLYNTFMKWPTLCSFFSLYSTALFFSIFFIEKWVKNEITYRIYILTHELSKLRQSKWIFH